MTEATVRESPPLPGSTVQAEFLGHPKGLSFLFATEMWERFSYYGMRALLVLYMVKYVLSPDTGQVIGLAALKRALEALLGPLDVQPLASNIYGLYTGLVYLTPVFGGIVADRVLGHRRTVIIGALLMALGHFMMAFEPLLLAARLRHARRAGRLALRLRRRRRQHADRARDLSCRLVASAARSASHQGGEARRTSL